METKTIPFPGISPLWNNKMFSAVWLVVRLYVGWEWLHAGWEKLQNPVWAGASAGAALKGFLMGALAKTTGQHPDVTAWYAWLIHHVFLPHTALFSYLVTYGEIAVGVALIAGVCTGVAAFFGAFMNVNYLLAGTVSINPQLLVLEILLLLAWRIAGFIGADYFITKRFRT